MSNTLLDAAKAVFTEDLRPKIATLLGERLPDTNKALDTAVPAVLVAMLQRSELPDGPMALYNLSKQAAAGDLHGSLHELVTGTGGLTVGNTLSSRGREYAQALLGEHTGPMTEALSRHAGVKADTASFLLGLAAFSALDAAGRHILHSHLDVSDFRQWLWSQRDGIVRAIPPGFDAAAPLGLKRLPGSKETASSKRNSMIYGVIALIILAGILFYVFKTCNRPATGPNGSDTTAVSATDTGAAVMTLPDGSTLNAPKGSTEEALVAFLSDSAQKVDPHGSWFECTDVRFASNSAQLLLSSEAQLRNLVAILKAFPKARVRVGAYTDNTGDSLENLRLSQARADTVYKKLKDLGAPSPQLLGDKGYGSQYPIGDNGTPVGRSENRRIALEVKEK